ncbi:MAG: ABC transporter substrate-binding protein [Bacteroidetes bacterium]|nr:MAG: ABC transporter substrate-binding protein [Bacteroidota bacterium]
MKNNIIGIISFFLFLLILFESCSNQQPKTDTRTVFRLNESNGLSSLDPAFAKDLANLNVCNQLYNGLVQLDSNLHIKAAIAKKWTISPDGKTYTFTLRSDVFFHDSKAFPNGSGRKVLAKDFVFSFLRIVNEQSVSPGAWVFNMVKKNANNYAFFSPNDSTLIIELKKPFAPFLSLLSMQYCSVVPSEAVKFFGDNFRRNPVGTGPFYLKYWEEDVKLVLLKNPNYFEKSKNKNLPFLDAINYTFLVDKQSEFLEFIQGNLDYLSGVEAGFKDEILDANGNINKKYKTKINLEKSPYLNTEYIGILYDTSINSVADSPLKYLKFRQAINYAIDKKKMLHYLRNNVGVPGNRGFLPSAYSFENIKYGYPYNKQKAQQLINELKQKLNISEFSPVSLVATSKSLDLVKFVQHQLAEIGVPMEIELMQWATMKEVVANSKALFFRASWIADYPDPENYLSLFYSKNFAPKGPNYTRFSNSKFDSLYNYSIFASDKVVKQRLYRAMDSLIMQEAVIIPLYYDEVMRFTQKSIKYLPTSPMNLLNLKMVQKEN